MISKPRFNLPILRIPRRAVLQPIRHSLKRRIKTPPRLPPQTPSLPRLVLGELPRHLVEFRPGL